MLPSNLSLQRISIVGDNSLFEEGVAHLLTLGTDLAVSGITYTDDLSFLNAISHNKPDAILLNESTTFDVCHILELLFTESSLSARYVIVIRLDNNTVDVYEMPKRFVITKRDELINVVRGNFQLA